MRQFIQLTYNGLLAIGWASFLGLQIAHGFELDAATRLLLNICQGAAVFEIVQAGLKWVKSPVFTTAIQIGSRLLVLVFINVVPANAHIGYAGITGIHLITLAWGITEVVRYSYYFLSLLKKEVAPLTFMRYTFFLILYPTGVTGEILILFSYIKNTGWQWSLINIALYIIMLSYLYFFPQLFGYMLKQRKKKLG